MIGVSEVFEGIVAWAGNRSRVEKGTFGNHYIEYNMSSDMITIHIRRGDLHSFRMLTIETLMFHNKGWRKYVAIVIRDMRRSLRNGMSAWVKIGEVK